MSNSRAAPPHSYVLGHSSHEIERLKAQARRIDPITLRFFRDAGLASGMRVLDVGSGAGDVAFLAAELVGSAGQVVGVDRSAEALVIARKRAAERSLPNVSFRVGDPGEMTFEQPFDAIIGRYVLQFQKDPAAMLRSLGAVVRSGGLIAFHEIDWGGLASLPPVPTFDQCSRWGAETMRRHGTETRMGSKLYAAFVAAGLPPPALRQEAQMGGGAGGAELLQMVVNLIATLAPEMERQGVATAAQVGLDTLLQRMTEELNATTSVITGHFQVCAWTRR